jgi:Uncharacterized protein conserved in bacteria
MPLSPYISFAGNCAEASAFYQHAVGAELLYKITFGEMPKSDNSAEGCPSGMQFPDSAIAHSNVRIAGSDIMVGAGGIGVTLWEAIRGFQFQQTCALMVLIIITVSLLDFLSQRLRKHFI